MTFTVSNGTPADVEQIVVVMQHALRGPLALKAAVQGLGSITLFVNWTNQVATIAFTATINGSQSCSVNGTISNWSLLRDAHAAVATPTREFGVLEISPCAMAARDP